MRIVFVGAVEFSQHCLEEVLKNGGNVVAVITIAKERATFHSDYADLSEVATRYRVPVYKISSSINKPENVALIRSLQPDVIFVFGWSQLISREILNIPPLGCIGSHPALLPKNRGRHPLIWALVEGLEESGLTFFYMDEGADSGDILWQKAFPITLEDDARSLYDKIKALASEGIKEFLPQLINGTAPRIPQNHSQATYWRKRTENDGEINWSAPTLASYNLIRALTRPYVGAHTYVEGHKMIVWRAILPRAPIPPEAKDLEPGTVFATDGLSFDVRTGDNYLTVLEYEGEGKVFIKVSVRLGGNT